MKDEINKRKDALIFAIICMLLLFLGNYTLITILAIPILMAIKLVQFDEKNKLIFLFLSGLFAAIFDLEITLAIFLPLTLFAILMSYLIKKDTYDKKTIAILTITLTIFIFFLLGYIYIKGYVKVDKIIDEVKKLFDSSGLKVDRKNIKITLSTIPSFFVIFNLIYSFISLKLVRNYLNYKDENIRDLDDFANFRISIKDLGLITIIVFIVTIIIYFIGIDKLIIIANLKLFFSYLLLINGILLVIYINKQNPSKIQRIMTILILIMLFFYLYYVLIVIGLIDSIINIRKRVRRI